MSPISSVAPRRSSRGGPPAERPLGGLPAILCLLLLVAIPGARGEAASPPLVEHEVKANFLYNFAKFVEWPAARFANAASPIVIGVLGSNPVGDQLASNLKGSLKGKQIDGRDVVMKPVDTVAEIRGVHILFVGLAQDAQFALIAPLIQGMPVLTVGESPQFSSRRGMISFVIQGNKVQFEINQDAADKAGVKISSQLLKVATKVIKSN